MMPPDRDRKHHPATPATTGSALRAGQARSSLSPCRTTSGTAAGPARRSCVVLYRKHQAYPFWGAAKPFNGPTSAWSNGYASDLLWSDPTFVVGTGTLNHSNHTPCGFWSGDGGNTWSNFATLPNGADHHEYPFQLPPGG
jgi:hypothetical protein